MPTKPLPVTPATIGIGAALDGSAPLARLRDALRDSNARLAAVRGVLPAGLLEHVRPGPVDAEGWSLLVANAGVAAKLRQLRPLLEAELRRAGWSPACVRIKVLAP